MPIPKPNKDERKVDYLPRCMSNPTMNEDYPNNDQRYAVCQSTWNRSKAMLEAARNIKESGADPYDYALLIGVAPFDMDNFLDEIEEYLEDNEEEFRTLADLDLKPTETMANNAERGLQLREEYNRGGTAVGVARARDLKNRKELSPQTVQRMYSYFSRHEVDKQGQGWNSGEEGYPSAGLIAWLLWGGDAGKTWAESKWNQIKKIKEQK